MYELNPRIGWRNNGPELVSLNCTTHQLVVWNESATSLWNLIAGGSREADIADWMCDSYGLDRQTATVDLREFVVDLEEKGLLVGNASGSDNIHATTTRADEDPMDLLKYVEMQSIKRLIPYSVTFESTYRCNERCVHCFMDRSGAELETAKIASILGEIAEQGCLFVSFTGGEFFTRKDWLEILEAASGLHFAIDILTNGTLITDAHVVQLVKLPVRRLQISLYGSTAETHDAVTRLDGSFARSIGAIRRLREAGFKVEISLPLMQSNFNQRHEVMEFAKQLGCTLTASHLITARNDGSTDTFGFRLSEEQLELFWRDEELSGSYAGRKPFADHELYSIIPSIQDAAPCYSGFNTCAVNPSGIVYPCNQLIYPVGDLKQEAFAEIWHGQKISRLREMTISQLPICSKCPILMSCARCPGLALLEGGDLVGKSEENCRNARILHQIELERR